jgi:hypothetical protein
MAKTRRVLKRGKRSSRSRRHSDRTGETIESLQASFEKVDTRAHALIEQGRTDSELAAALMEMWSDQFGTDLSHTAADGLVKHYRALHKGTGRKTRKARGRRHQVGGMAPMGWTMGQGITDYTYGRFPAWIGASPQVDALDRFAENPISRACDATGGAPAPGQTGGSLWSTLGMGHPPTSVPQNVVATVVSTVQGAPMTNPPASPVSATVPVAPYEPRPFQPGELTSIGTMTNLYKPTQ